MTDPRPVPLTSFRLRLHPKLPLDPSVPSFDTLPETTTLLVRDTGALLESVHDDRWGARPVDERARTFATALDATLAAAKTTREDTRLPSGVPISMWTGDEHITSTLALAVQRLLPADPRWGALVAVPRSQMVVAHAIADQGVVPAASSLAVIARGIFGEGPDPCISPHVYWVRGDHAEALAIEVDLAARRATRFSPSTMFADEVLIPLAGDHLR